MGWKLAEEVAWARPDQAGAEWWTLLDLAQSARDDTRQALPGFDYLIGRAKCSRATIYRRLNKLRDQKLIKVIQQSGPGTRAVYEISDELIPWSTRLSISETRSGLTLDETCSTPPATSNGHTTGRSLSETHSADPTGLNLAATGLKIGTTGLALGETPPVKLPSVLPSITPAAVVPPSVEVPPAGLDGAARQPIEQQAWLALHSRM